MAYVFVHGGAHTGECWSRLTPLLAAPSLTLDLPGRRDRVGDLRTLGIDDWVDAIVEDIDALDDDRVVLVGHSLAGMSLPRVIGRIPDRLAHVVFVSCTVPPEGRSTMDGLDAETEALARSAETRAEPTVIGEDAARAMFCTDMDEEQTRFALAGLVPEATRPILEPSRLAGLAKGVPLTWIRLLRDPIVPPERQDAYVETIREITPIDVVDIDAGHNVMISQPAALARRIEEIHAAALGA